MTDAEIIATLEQASQIISIITRNDLRMNVKWLGHLRIAKGYLEDAIRELKRI